MKNLVVIGSQNPSKVSAVKKAFNTVFPEEDFIYESVSVSSGVSRQPLTERETEKGAMNRIEACKEGFPKANYWVGIEGGVEPVKEDLLLVEWVYVLNTDGEIGKGRGLSFIVPSKMAKDISKGLSIGQTNDRIFNKNNTGDGIGLVGTLTKELITREEFLKEACIVALIRFSNRELY
jgi:inosine/xanthosine triphosphatase